MIRRSRLCDLDVQQYQRRLAGFQRRRAADQHTFWCLRLQGRVHMYRFGWAAALSVVIFAIPLLFSQVLLKRTRAAKQCLATTSFRSRTESGRIRRSNATARSVAMHDVAVSVGWWRGDQSKRSELRITGRQAKQFDCICIEHHRHILQRFIRTQIHRTRNRCPLVVVRGNCKASDRWVVRCHSAYFGLERLAF